MSPPDKAAGSTRKPRSGLGRDVDGDPGPVAWTVAAISLILPWLGVVLCLVGGIRVGQGRDLGWPLAGAGVALIALDIIVDFVWAHPTVSISDQPDLNRRGEQLVGRVVIVAEAISQGRGTARVGDTLWPIEGPDTQSDMPVRVVAAADNVLRVERV